MRLNLLMTGLLAFAALTACSNSHERPAGADAGTDAPSLDAAPPQPDAAADDPSDRCTHRALCEDACRVFEGSSTQCCDDGAGCSDADAIRFCIEDCCEDTESLTEACASCAVDSIGFSGGCNDFECACFISTSNASSSACTAECG